MNLILKLITLLPVFILSVQNTYAQENSLNTNSLDFIFKNYEGQSNKYVPKLENHRIPKQTRDLDLNKNTNDNNLNFESFLEIREFAKSDVILRSLPNKNGVPLYSLKPGNMVKVKFSLHDYMRAQQAEKKNLGFWRKIKTTGILGEKNFYFFSHWKEMQALNPYEKVNLDILVPKNQVSVPVFSKPGYTNWRECSQVYELCRAFIDTYSNVELIDAKIFEIDNSYTAQKSWELFYKVKFSYLKSDAQSSTGTGWIPARFAKRKIKPLSLAIYNLARDRNPAGLDGTGINGAKKFFVFDKNKKNPHISESRWLSSTSANQLKYKSGLYDQNFAFDAIVGGNYTSLTQKFFDDGEDLVQYGINAGLRLSAPLFLDVDLEASATVSAPLSSTNDKESTFIYLQQMFNVTIPRHWMNAPIKIGLGGYYYVMTNNTDEYGFKSLIGFHTRLKYDAKKWHAFIRFAPIGVDLDGEFKDREISFGGGFKLDETKGYDSPHINIEMTDVYYRPQNELEIERTIEMKKFDINYIHPF